MIKTIKKEVLLVGDIGGTTTTLGYLTEFNGSPKFRQLATYSSTEADGIGDILAQYLDQNRIEVKAACLGIAGPVMEGNCKTTNLPWEVSETALKKRFRWPKVKLINDLAATAVSIPFLGKDDTVSISPGKAVEKQTIALMAPGTGLGQSLLVWVKDHYQPVPSEGGHADFAPATEEEVLLWRYLYEKYGHASIERAASGPGLINIYSWLRTSQENTEPQWLKKRMKTSDPAAVIAHAGLDEEDSICKKALDCFTSILGSVAGNLALTGFARGGVYLGGGIPPKILPKLKENTFRQSFVKKGRFKKFLEEIPVHVILNERAALLGAAYYAERLIK